MSKRLFIGSMLGRPEQEQVAALNSKLLQVFPSYWKDCKLRFVRPEKLHMTWLFLGDCSASDESSARQWLADNIGASKPFAISYEELAIFGSRTRPTAVVLIPRLLLPGLEELGRQLRKELGHLCQKQDEKPFRPHLTLCRFPHNFRRPVRLKEELDLKGFLPLRQEIASLSLVESHLGKQNDAYEVIAEYKLCS